MKGSFLALLIYFVLASDARAANSGLLQFQDGSSLHGELSKIDVSQGVSWAHPASRLPLVFTPTNLSSIRFDKVDLPATNNFGNCRFYFRNGDEIMGNLVRFDGTNAQIETWFGGTMQSARENLEGIVLSAKGYRLLYEGPNGLDGWKVGRNPRSWEYKDGAFMANGADLLGRDFGLSGSSSLEFDIAWTGSFSLSITMYAQAIDRFDYSSSAYLLYLGPGAISVQRVQAGVGPGMLGQAQIPDMAKKSKMRFEIRCNREDSTISVFTDGKLLHRWKDTLGFAPKGSGIVFFSQVEPRGLKLSNIRVAEWETRAEPDLGTNALPAGDILFLANKDRVVGEFQLVKDEKITMKTRQGNIEIPLSRVTQIRFASEEPSARTVEPWQLRAAFPGGESLGFTLQEWNEEKVSGRSSIFGEINFKPGLIRQLIFSSERFENQTRKIEELEAFPEFE